MRPKKKNTLLPYSGRAFLFIIYILYKSTHIKK
nr:MAG TPA: hypothetical protein [Caudoviricetes sp.]